MRRTLWTNLGPVLYMLGGLMFMGGAVAMFAAADEPTRAKVIEAQVIRLKSPNGKFSVVMQAADDQAFVSLKGEDGRVAVVFVSTKDRGLIVHGDKGVKEVKLGTEAGKMPTLYVYDDGQTAKTPDWRTVLGPGPTTITVPIPKDVQEQIKRR